MDKNEGKFDLLKKRISSSVSTKVILLVVIVVVALILWQQLSRTGRRPNMAQQTAAQSVIRKVPEAGQDVQNVKPADMTPTDGSKLLFDKQQQNVAKGAEVTLLAMENPNGKKITAVDLHVVFDPKLLKLESIEPSDVFSLVLGNAQIDNSAGTASIAVGVPLDGKSTDAAATIASLNFQALSTGSATVSYSDKAVAAAENEKGNVVAVRGSAIINVQ